LLCLAIGLLINNKCIDCATEATISREEFENLKTTVNRQSEQIHQLLGFISSFTSENQRHENSEDNVKSPAIERRYIKSASKVKRYNHDTVAFFATLSVHSLDHLDAQKNIIYNEILTNIGNGYNNSNGVFTAPVSGLYLITTSVLSRQDMEFWVVIAVNDQVIVRLNERGTDGRHGSGSQTIILSLNKGDEVEVQNEHTDDSFWGNKYSSFGGYLLQALESEPSSIMG
ncbi:complement C1q tumor necrosis factor-related protein 3-like, partial [Ruditapes philippinarum]|uniref:complement C1q tumor necrosis factor-related protein 3-like n=1 Tax=Ruditapes philippinarum TaxID=129788 RepID=UPI00295B67DE